jgi:hypothetical protein
VATRAEGRHADNRRFDRLKDDWIQKLTQNFGDDEGNEVNFNGTVDPGPADDERPRAEHRDRGRHAQEEGPG